MGFTELINQLPELIGSAIQANQWMGYFAIFVAMFLENLFPPIPSELIIKFSKSIFAENFLTKDES